MANLIVTFTSAADNARSPHGPPLATGSAVRTEEIEITSNTDGSGNAGALAAVDGETVVELTALAACWVVVGPAPTVEAGEGRYMAEGGYRELSVAVGDKIAVVAAA